MRGRRKEIGTNTPQTIVRQGKQGRVMRALFVDLPRIYCPAKLVRPGQAEEGRHSEGFIIVRPSACVLGPHLAAVCASRYSPLFGLCQAGCLLPFPLL